MDIASNHWLYFCFHVYSLAWLIELIAFAGYFHNVCELDLVFNFWKVIQLLDEMFLAGELVESSKQVILERMHLLDKNNKESVAPAVAKEKRKEAALSKDKKPKKEKPGPGA